MDYTAVIKQLIALGVVDTALGHIAAEQARTEKILAAKRHELAKLIADRDAKERVAKDRKIHYQREERTLRDERDKLSERRKALSSLASHKLIQAAEREIEASTRQLDALEEVLLKALDEAEALERAFNEAREKVARLEGEFATLSQETNATLENLASRRATRTAERQSIASTVDGAVMIQYERVCRRYPHDAVVPIKNGICAGCFIQVAPQLAVEAARGTALVKCRGCGRLLYPSAPDQEQTSSAK